MLRSNLHKTLLVSGQLQHPQMGQSLSSLDNADIDGVVESAVQCALVSLVSRNFETMWLISVVLLLTSSTYVSKLGLQMQTSGQLKRLQPKNLFRCTNSLTQQLAAARPFPVQKF